MADYPDDGLADANDNRQQEQAAEEMFAGTGEGAKRWAPGDIHMPSGYIPTASDKTWRDSRVGPILRREPTHHPNVMGSDEDDEENLQGGPPTPITGHTPPGTPQGRQEQEVARAAETMTLTQAHRWWEFGDADAEDTDPHW